MPRTAREKSSTGVYHIMLRGIDKRDIFLSERDYEKFLFYMVRAKEKSDATIYAYCLMTNHIHILLKTDDEIGAIVKRIAVGYAQYHNIKYGRTGHLFQNRFRSEVVDSDRYFLTVLRYIHQNPIKAGIVIKVEDYKWSSYNEYVDENNQKEIAETTFALSFFSDVKTFDTFIKANNQDKCLEYEERKRYTDKGLTKDILMLLSMKDISDIKKLDKRTRNQLIEEIKEKTGVSNRQLARVLNINRGILERMK